MSPDRPEVEVRRSRRRTRTVSAYRSEGKVIVLIPDRFSRREEAEWVDKMIAQLERSEWRTKRGSSDADLMRRANRLAAEYLGGSVRPTSVRWVTNMSSRWASCTSATGAIRVSALLQQMPEAVIDCVLLHELAHLIEPNHSRRFWALADRHPRAEWAKGYLDGVAAAAGLTFGESDLSES